MILDRFIEQTVFSTIISPTILIEDQTKQSSMPYVFSSQEELEILAKYFIWQGKYDMKIILKTNMINVNYYF